MRLNVRLSAVILLVLVGAQSRAQNLSCSARLSLRPGEVGQISLVEGGGGRVRFRYDGALSVFNGAPIPDERNYVVVVPSSGVTPQAVSVGINPTVAKQFNPGGSNGLYLAFTTVDQTPAVRASCIISLIVPAEPAPTIRSVVNSASLQPSLAPGALVTVLGSNLTGPTQSTNYGPTANYPTAVASTSVTFNGIAAPLLYLSPGQINAIVPFALAGQTSAQVQVQRFDKVSASFSLPLQDISPGIFTATQTGTGQAAILQQGPDGQFTYNSAENPVPKGAAVSIFATGAGVWTPLSEYDVFLQGRYFTTRPVSVMIGGQAARVLYAGTGGTSSGPGLWSMLQVNAIVPDAVGSGPQSVVLKVGGNDNSQQKVTVHVQ
jgi:trimeric autotransporter adhesin